MDIIGRNDPVTRLSGYLRGLDVGPLGIVSISGPGGIGKSFLLQHALDTTDLGGRRFLRLRVEGAQRARSLDEIVARDIPRSCTQLDDRDGAEFKHLRQCWRALETMSADARAEVDREVARRPELRETLGELHRLGLGVQDLVPQLRQYFDLKKIKAEQLDGLASLYEKAEAFRPEGRWLNGVLPDLRQAGFRNQLRSRLAATLADALVADLAAIFERYRDPDRHRPTPSRPDGLARLLLVIDDYESVEPVLGEFLGDHLVPALARSDFESLLVIVGRDRVVDTSPVWQRKHAARLTQGIKLTEFSADEAERYVLDRGITDPETIARICRDTEGYPYLLAGEVEAELEGGRSALAITNFFDRITQWMNARQREWFLPLCFVDEVNEESIGAMLPGEAAGEVLAWFKRESSIRAPSAARWTVLPIIRSRIREYVRNDSRARFEDFERRAATCQGG